MFRKLDALEAPLCMRLVRCAQRKPVCQAFIFFSWLGNGPAWGILLAVACTYQWQGLGQALVSVTLINALIYRQLKHYTIRRRPFVAHGDIQARTRALDEFSFPSGHTLHAVAITLTLAPFYPLMAMALLPVVVMIMGSRVALGLHYPSDVLAGAALGWAVSEWVLGFL
ncbi:MAG: phosphatase PAP2 family protein [Litorivicinus sp.]